MRGSFAFSIKNRLEEIRDVLASEKMLQLKKVNTPPVLVIYLDIAQFVLIPTSVYVNNKKLFTQSVTKQELSKYQFSQNLMYQIGSLKKEINKSIFSKADSLVDKIWSCPRIKLSKS